MVRLGGGDREDVATQLRFLEPARKRAFEDPRPALAQSSPGDDEHATPTRAAGCGNEGGEGQMRLGLSHSVQIEACLYPVQAALQPFCVGTVDPGETLQRGHSPRSRTNLLHSHRSRIHGGTGRIHDNRSVAAQRPHIADRLSP